MKMNLLTLTTIFIIVSTSSTFGQENLVSIVPNVPQLNVLDRVLDAVGSFANCLLTTETEDKHLGLLSRNASYFCTTQTQRLPYGVFCCSPQSSDSIRFLLSTPDGRIKSEEVKYFDENISEIFENQEKVVYIIHGFVDRVSNSQFVNQTRDGYLKRGSSVVVIDWGDLNQLSYWQAIANVRTVGAAVGYSILNWDISDKTLIVGFSLGGQAMAEAGKYVNQHGNGKQVAECHGLDPAGPWFDPLWGFKLDMELDKSDCKVVQVIHSSASYLPMLSTETIETLKFGTAFKSGHCDFWINCGHDQGDLCHGDFNFIKLLQGLANIPKDGGEDVTEFILSHACSHYKSAMMYADAVNRNCESTPLASTCSDCGPTVPSIKGPKHDCTARPDLGVEAFPPDNVCTPNDDANFVVFSTNYRPFCQGTV